MNGVQTPVRRVTVTQRGAIVPTSVATIRAAIDAIEAGAWVGQSHLNSLWRHNVPH
jgi:hypothetical protein